MRTVAWEHISFPRRSPDVRAAMQRLGHRLHAVVVLTEEDRDDYTDLLGHRAPIVRIPKRPAAAAGPVSPLTEHIVLAIGRLTRQKGFDRLIAAFEPVARQHPDWRLHIFGTGVDRDQLLHAVVDRDLGDQVALLGSTQHLDEM